MHEPKQPQSQIRLERSTCGQGFSLTYGNISEEEQQSLQGVMTGQRWMRCVDGRLEFFDAYKTPPGPVDDPVVHPYWPTSANVESRQLELPFGNLTGWASPHIIIQHICGYRWTESRYTYIVTRLESYGFECLRSRRGANAQYWEIWYLPYLAAARGDLKLVMDAVSTMHADWEPRLNAALDFLVRNTSFGTLDVSVQRIAQVVE